MDARIPAACNPAERRSFEDTTGATLDGRAPIYRSPKEAIEELPGVVEAEVFVGTPVDWYPVADVHVVMGRGATRTDRATTSDRIRGILSCYDIGMCDVQVHDSHDCFPPPNYEPVSPSYSPTSPSYKPDFGPETNPDPDKEGTLPPAKRTKGPTPVARDEA